MTNTYSPIPLDENWKSGVSMAHLSYNGPKPETPEHTRERKAREIPEETFASDEELSRLRHERDLKAAIAEDPHRFGRWLAKHGQGKGITQEAEREALMWAMLEDALNQDDGFPRTFATLQDLFVRRRYQKALDDLLNRLNDRSYCGHIKERADHAKRDHENHLLALQLAQLDKMDGAT